MRAVLCALLAALAARAAEREPRGAPRCSHERCRYIGYDEIWGKLQYEVDGSLIMIRGSLIMKRWPTDYLDTDCKRASVLESPALPSFETLLHVSHWSLTKCPLTGSTSLADTLATLNVTLEVRDSDALEEVSCNLFIMLDSLSASVPLAAKHFDGLEHLINLSIYGVMDSTAPATECAFLTPLQNLRSLTIQHVVLPTCELYVPPSLRILDLGIYNGSRLPVVPALEQLHVSFWMEPQPAPLSHCDSLRELKLFYPKMRVLPDGWLANCSRLKVLDIKGATYLTTLPPKLLVGMKALRKFSFTFGDLETLPAGLLDYSPYLSSLTLGFIHLKMLPSGLFDVARRVQELDLNSNRLNSSALDALAPLVELTDLILMSNPSIGDVCLKNGYSMIHNLTKLRRMLLENTGVTQICRDWREDMLVLERLDLSGTNVNKLSFQDLQFTRNVSATVKLSPLDVPVTVVQMTREDYNNGARGLTSDINVQLYNLAPVECDCSMYWTRRMLDLSGPASRIVGSLHCTDGRPLRDVSPEDMVCERPAECTAAALPAACSCDTRPDDDSDHDRLLVRVRCENASLTSVPRPGALNVSTGRLYELLLAHNLIANLTADDLRHDIKGLDLRSNLLQGVDEATVKKFSHFNGTLRLAGNPFECDCHAAALQRALRSRDLARTDWNNVTCSNGSALYNLDFVDCPQLVAPSKPSLGTWLASGLAALLALALIIVTFLASRERRFFMQAVLHRWGFVWRADEPADDDDYRYDAFVTFSHKNKELVQELIARLEPTYRLCVHYRDWTPGRFISEQVMESVRESRRTIALVSRHFLASSWARAELREAQAAMMVDPRPRLIVVLLEELATLKIDDLLHRYVATHTYLRWGEPWFWDKLAVALPRPRAPRAPEPAPPVTPPARDSQMIKNI